MQTPRSSHLLALLAMFLLFAAAPLAAQDKKRDSQPRTSEAVRPATTTPQVERPVTRSTPAPSRSPVARPEARSTNPSVGRPGAGAGVHGRGSRGDHGDIGDIISNTLRDGYDRAARRPNRRNDARAHRTSDSRDARPEAFSPGAVEGAAHIERFIRSDDGSGELRLVDKGASVGERAKALEQLRILLERQRLEQLRQERQRQGVDPAVVAPEVDDAATQSTRDPVVRSPHDDDSRFRCDDSAPCDDGAFPRRPPRTGDGVDDGDDEETPPPPVVRPPVEVPAVPVVGQRFWSDSRLSSCNPMFSSFVGMYGYGIGVLSRRDPLWYDSHRSMASRHGHAYDDWLACSGVQIGASYNWHLYEQRFRDKAADCAEVTVQRHDDAAVSFHVRLPALGAGTPIELRKAIEERLSHGETVALDITLRPDEVKDVSVKACSDAEHD